MRKTRHFSFAAFTALASSLFLIYLIVQIDKVLQEMQSDGVLEFSFIQQVDHNLDQLIDSLTRFQLASGEDDLDALQMAYITRFDVLYSALFTVKPGWLNYLADHQSSSKLIDESQSFLARYEPLMQQDVKPDEDMLTRIAQEARALSQRIYETAQIFSKQKSAARDRQSSRMDQLLTHFWLTGCVFLVVLSFAMTHCLIRSR